MQACPSLRSSRKRWALVASLVSSGSREGEAQWVGVVGSKAVVTWLLPLGKFFVSHQPEL